MTSKWQRLHFHPCLPLGEDGRRATESPRHIALSRAAAAEGMVLLKNENHLLPLAKNTHVALFGKGSADYVRGGGGSGEVTVSYTRNLCDGMEQKEREHKIACYTPLHEFYRRNVRLQYEAGIRTGWTVEPELPDELVRAARTRTDVAVISICRFSSEGKDRRGLPGDGDFYLSPEEEAMVKKVVDAYDHIVVILNVGGMVDTSWCVREPKIEAVLLGWQAGMEGAMAEADLLVGDKCPSGRLTDTFASSFDDYPSSAHFNDSDDYVEYNDDIYVGYRYFETIPGAREKVNYPFGFGLSYTSFDVFCTDVSEEGDSIRLTVNVSNTGNYVGKEVVQVYFSAPRGKLGKPAAQLVAFAKTPDLRPGENRDLVFDVPVSDMASFDDVGAVCRAAWVLEQGEYKIWVGTSVARRWEVFSHTEPADRIVAQCGAFVSPKKLTCRLRDDGTYETLPVSEYDFTFPDTSAWPRKAGWGIEHVQADGGCCTTWGLEHFGPPYMQGADIADEIKEGRYYTLQSVADGKCTLEQLLDQMSVEDYLDLVSGSANTGVSDTYAIGGLLHRDVVPACTADGPAGVRIPGSRGVCTTAWPCATALACTWNTDLVEEVGAAGGLELKENNLALWLTPAMNIHRSPLCGRNFEYYSEDPLISGKMAAALTRGIQSNGVGACAKHFCCNNKETNRSHSDSRVSERALREIYLRGFEIAVREAQPMAIMTSYNIVNGIRPSENKELLDGILRGEWGFAGIVITDWCNGGEHYREVLAGNDVRMPAGSKRRLQAAMAEGLLTREDLCKCAERVLKFVLRLD